MSHYVRLIHWREQQTKMDKDILELLIKTWHNFHHAQYAYIHKTLDISNAPITSLEGHSDLTNRPEAVLGLLASPVDAPANYLAILV